jgi:mannose-6-phosphate isomerase-like protein (cupin superfamily)
MNYSIKELIESGVLELYVMGAANHVETQMVEKMASEYPEIQREIENISDVMEGYARAHAVKPRSTVKALLLATIDYMERMQEGEVPVSPPILSESSRIEDYEFWLNQTDMHLPESADNLYAKIIGYSPAATTAIVWVRTMSDPEIHQDEYERFLIVEGTCNIMAGGKNYQLKSGNFFEIPLNTEHVLTVTSEVPCKAVLQRIKC